MMRVKKYQVREGTSEFLISGTAPHECSSLYLRVLGKGDGVGDGEWGTMEVGTKGLGVEVLRCKEI